MVLLNCGNTVLKVKLKVSHTHKASILPLSHMVWPLEHLGVCNLVLDFPVGRSELVGWGQKKRESRRSFRGHWVRNPVLCLPAGTELG